jgi:hypothetical protein
MGMRVSRPNARPALLLALLAGILALAGCGSSSIARPAARAVPTATSTPTVAATTTPATTPPIQTSFEGPCTPDTLNGPNAFPGRIGDLLVGQLSFQEPAYPGYVLSESLALAPLKITSVRNVIQGQPMSNPGVFQGAQGFAFTICNASATQPHVLAHVAVKIHAFAPYTGHLNEVRTCALSYSRQGMQGGGCGGASANDVYLKGAFAANAGLGAVAPTDTMQSSNVGPLPITLAPGEGINIVASATLPTVPGTYDFVVGVALDGGTLTFPSGPTMSALYAPVAHEWSGENCTRPEMLAQIPPATDPPSYYICPSA